MRRKKDNQTFIFIVLVAVFTLFSYIFDQLVIQTEDSLRNKNIELRNLNTESLTASSINMQLEDINTANNRFFENFLTRKNYWLKNHLLLKRYDLGKVDFKKNYHRYGNYIENWVKYQMVMRYDISKDQSTETYFSLNQIIENYPRIFEEEIKGSLLNTQDPSLIKDNKIMGYKSINTFLRSYYNFEKIFNDNQNLFFKKDFKFYDELTKIDPSEDFPDLIVEEWIDLANLTTLIFINIEKNSHFIQDKIDQLDRLNTKFIEKIEFKTQSIRESSAKKNYFILLSIISQILSLLFLLLLFKNILKIVKTN